MKEENKNSNSRTEALEDVLKSYEEQIDKDKRDKLLEDKGFQDIEGELKINSYEEYERLKNENERLKKENEELKKENIDLLLKDNQRSVDNERSYLKFLEKAAIKQEEKGNWGENQQTQPSIEEQILFKREITF
jgi:hypothetical protein